jgi:hypothetical protein
MQADSSSTDVEGKNENVNSTEPTNTSQQHTRINQIQLPTTTKIFEVYHSAPFDSYMTGFVYLYQKLTHESLHNNMVYLIGKDFALKLEKSMYEKTSVCHRDKMEKIRKGMLL